MSEFDPFDGAFDTDDEEEGDCKSSAIEHQRDNQNILLKLWAAPQDGGGPVSVARVPLKELTPTSFLEKYSNQGRPVIITEAESILPMHLTPNYLTKHYGDKKVIIDIYTKDAVMTSLENFLSMQDSKLCQKYLRNLHMHRFFPEELANLKFPEVFGTNYLSDECFVECPDSWRAWFELFINTRYCKGFPFLHRDVCNTHAFSMQIQGVKRFWMFPPEQSNFLYPSGGGGGTGCHSEITESLDSPQLFSKYPAVAQATPSVIDLNAGELLFIPANYWHTTKTVSILPSITIGGNFVDETNRESFLDAYADYQASLQLRKQQQQKTTAANTPAAKCE